MGVFITKFSVPILNVSDVPTSYSLTALHELSETTLLNKESSSEDLSPTLNNKVSNMKRFKTGNEVSVSISYSPKIFFSLISVNNVLKKKGSN